MKKQATEIIKIKCLNVYSYINLQVHNLLLLLHIDTIILFSGNG